MKIKISCIYIAIILFVLTTACKKGKQKGIIKEEQLGIIDASVTSEETNLKEMAKYNSATPGSSERIGRSFENAPPLIPHTIEGFFPIKIQNNICLSCHMPDKVKSSGAVQISATHFTSMRPKIVEVDGILTFTDETDVQVRELDSLNSAYFSCSQCHVPQTNVSVNIENLFTPEFREEFGLEKSNLKEKLKEGI